MNAYTSVLLCGSNVTIIHLFFNPWYICLIPNCQCYQKDFNPQTYQNWWLINTFIWGGKKNSCVHCNLTDPLNPPPPPTRLNFFPNFQKNIIYKVIHNLIIGHQKCEKYKVFTINQLFYFLYKHKIWWSIMWAKMCIWVVHVENKNKKIEFRPTNPFFSRHVTVNTPISLFGLMYFWDLSSSSYA